MSFVKCRIQMNTGQKICASCENLQAKVTKKYFLSFAFLRLSSGQVFAVRSIFFLRALRVLRGEISVFFSGCALPPRARSKEFLVKIYSELCVLCGEYFFTGKPEAPKK
jgi:hypothetical protein